VPGCVQEFEISFECKPPGSAQKMELKGGQAVGLLGTHLAVTACILCGQGINSAKTGVHAPAYMQAWAHTMQQSSAQASLLQSAWLVVGPRQSMMQAAPLPPVAPHLCTTTILTAPAPPTQHPSTPSSHLPWSQQLQQGASSSSSQPLRPFPLQPPACARLCLSFNPGTVILGQP
jgi:hypothetical protein